MQEELLQFWLQHVLFTETECLVVSPDFKMPDENQILLMVPRQHNMYSFNMKTSAPIKDYACLIAKATSDESKLWHRRLGHINFKNLNKLVKGNLVRGLPSKVFRNDHTCVACQKDLVRSDNGTEFKKRDMLEFCGNKGIKQEYSNARTPQQNEVAERMNRTLIAAAIVTMLADSCLQAYVVGQKQLKKVKLRKSSTNSKIEETLTTPQQEKKDSSTDTSEDNPMILAFQRELEEIALKHLGTISENNTASTPAVNTGSESVNTGIFDEASYDEEGVITDFNSLPTEIEVSPTPTLRIHNIHPKSQILGDLKSAVQTRSKVQQCTFQLYSKAAKKQSQRSTDVCWPVFAISGNLKDFYNALQDDSGSSYARGVVISLNWCSRVHAGRRLLTVDEVFAPVARIAKPIRERSPFDLEASLIVIMGCQTLIGNPQIVKQFWQTATANTLADGTLDLARIFDYHCGYITEASIRNKFKLVDASGEFTMLPTMRFLRGWVNIEGIFLLTNLLPLQSLYFSKLILMAWCGKLEMPKQKFLMYPRFLQLILDIQIENKHPYLAVALTKKIFRNMKRGFRGAPSPLLPAMLLVATTNPSASVQEHLMWLNITIIIHNYRVQSPPPINAPIPALHLTPYP
ncbi:ribonuclease H-like domain-containing protein [Tanacetum coccineum]